jgi:hypothetical protein
MKLFSIIEIRCILEDAGLIITGVRGNISFKVEGGKWLKNLRVISKT